MVPFKRIPRILLPWSACVVLLNAPAVTADEHWAYRPIAHPVAPHVARDAGNPIDSFVRARLVMEGLEPAPPANRATIIRRVTIDLIGLPPTFEETDAFIADDRPDAYARLIERLLASPHYGERWARVWLDLAHYGDSDGHLTDQLRPVAWRYRDWVVRALNENMPFDRFTIAQLAGDLVQDDPAALFGTGFLRQTLSNREGGADLEEYRVEQIVDRTSMVGTIWLGLTVGCARCHDHKYDLLTQAEFFQLYAFFDQADEVNIDAPLPHEAVGYRQQRPLYEKRRREIVDRYRERLVPLQKDWEQKCLHAMRHPGEDPLWDRQWELLGLIWGAGRGEGQLEGTEIAKLPWEKRTERQQDDLLDYFLLHGSIIDPKRFSDAKLNALRDELTSLLQEYPAAKATRVAVVQAALNPRQTHIHESGDFRVPGAAVAPATPRWLPQELATHDDKSPTRLELAQWLVSRTNPLTARVIVNRMWQEFFGRGIVYSSNDFGARGDAPTHPELLDWLATEFMRSGWDVKHVHRLIVFSETYQQSSQPRQQFESRDPENALVARQASLRVPAEVIRDATLAVSGLLSRKMGGPSVFPPQHERVTMEAFGSNAWKVSEGSDRYRRGLYTFILRTSPFAQSITFDAPNPQQTCTRRDRSNTPLQALTLLNDPVFVEAADAFADRIESEGGADDASRVRFAWKTALGRLPSSSELDRSIAFLKEERADASDESEVWSRFASVVLNLHEFVTRD